MSAAGNKKICHVCEENETDFICDDCGEPVCEDCCVVPTYHNQIEYPFCTVCEDGRQERRSNEWERENKAQEAITAKNKAIADKRRATYRKPENVAKRKAAKAERKWIAAEQARDRLAQAFKIVNDMFR